MGRNLVLRSSEEEDTMAKESKEREHLPDDLQVTEFTVGEQRYALFSYREPGPFPAGVTESEWLVGLLVVAGHSNASIAAVRGVSPRTVANQLASLYRKLGVGPRSQLIARWSALFGPPPRP